MVIGLMWNIGDVRLFNSSPLMSVTVTCAPCEPVPETDVEATCNWQTQTQTSMLLGRSYL